MNRAVLQSRAAGVRRGVSAAFTLVELLVVMAVFVLILAIAVPAFSSMLYSSEQALAENSLKVGISAARDAAVRSGGGEDGAAVFTFQPGGRVTIIPCVKVGEILDVDPVEGGNVNPQLPREVFAPLPEIEPVQMPAGWSVRGYAPKGTIHITVPKESKNDWYEDTAGRRYETDPADSSIREANWVFPETSFFNQGEATSGSPPKAAIDGNNRQTFMIRFEGGTGVLKQMEGTPVVVLIPSPATKYRTTVSPWKEYRVDRETDLRQYVRQAMNYPVYALEKFPNNPRLWMIGYYSSDMVMARSVGQVAVYNEARLANALRVRPDRFTRSIYTVDPADVSTWKPAYVKDSSGAAIDTAKINAWIEGRLTDTGRPVASDARIFTISRYLGDAQELVAFGG